MIYSWHITTPANTAASSPVRTDLKLEYGVIHRVTIVFPTGCVGLAHLYILRAEHPVFPSNQGETFSGDGSSLVFPEWYVIDADPTVLEAYTYNLDDTYEHTITLYLALYPLSLLYGIPAGGWEQFIGSGGE